MLRKLLKKEKGFTLVELMVVILIIAILVVIAIPVYNSARDAARKRTCQANLRTLDGAVQTFHSDVDSWPGGMSDLTTNSKYIKEEPHCPSNTASTYIYDTGSHDFSCTVVSDHTY